MRDCVLLALQKTVNRVPEFRILQPVVRMRLRRHQAAGEFVLALRAAFEYLQAMRDRVLDALVVAGLEVQAGYVFHCAPMAAIQPCAVHQVE